MSQQKKPIEVSQAQTAETVYFHLTRTDNPPDVIVYTDFEGQYYLIPWLADFLSHPNILTKSFNLDFEARPELTGYVVAQITGLSKIDIFKRLIELHQQGKINLR